jgi:hypothetical protein
MGEVASASLETLLDTVAAVARSVSPSDPVACSMRTFNDGRASSPFPDAPTANAIHLAINKADRAHMSWREIVELALAAPTDRMPVLRAADRVEREPWLTRRHVFYALNRVAQFLQVETLVPREYREGRDALIRRERRRNPDRDVAGMLPTEGQIERIARDEREQARQAPAGISDWDFALLLAGLAVRAERPAVAPRRAESRRLPAAHGAAIYGAVNPALPSYPTLMQFAAETGFPLATKPSGPWSAVLDAAAKLLRDAGLPVPGRPRPLGRGGVLRFRVPTDPLGFEDIEPEVTHEQAIEALRAWDREQPGRDRSQRQYMSWQRGTEHPGLSTLQRHGAFSKLRTEALRLNRAGASPLCPPRSQQALAVTGELLRALAAGPTREVERRPDTGERKGVYRGPRPWLSHLIAAGLVSVHEPLIAEHRGERFTATFNADGDITVNGHPQPAPTPSEAKDLVTRYKSGGWKFWTVIRDGRSVPLAELRDRLAAQDSHERAA